MVGMFLCNYFILRALHQVINILFLCMTNDFACEKFVSREAYKCAIVFDNISKNFYERGIIKHYLYFFTFYFKSLYVAAVTSASFLYYNNHVRYCTRCQKICLFPSQIIFTIIFIRLSLGGVDAFTEPLGLLFITTN